MKVRVVYRKIYDYIRYDLKEIAFPSSLPDPPDILVLKRAARLYAASWVRDIGPDLWPNDYKDEMTDEPNGEKKTTKGKEPSTLEDLGSGFGSEGFALNLVVGLVDEFFPKDRTAPLFVLFPAFSRCSYYSKILVWAGCMTAFAVQIYQAWLLFLYTGLAFTESQWK